MPLLTCLLLPSTDILRNALEQRVDDLGEYLSVWTAIVVGGLILEYGVEFLEKAAQHGALKGGLGEPWLPSWFKSFRVMEIIGALMVIAGVTGELSTESARGVAEEQLREISNTVIGNLRETNRQIDLNLTATRLYLANKQSDLDNDIQAERQKTARFQVESAARERSAAKALTDAVDLQNKVNGSFLHRLLDRHVDVRLRDTLKSMPPARATVSCLESDTEVIVFAYEVRDALIESGWDVPPVVLLKKTPALASGVMIVNKSASGLFPFTGEVSPNIIAGMLSANSNTPTDMRLAILVSALQVRTLTKDTSMEDGFFRIVVGDNVLFNGSPLPPR